MRRNTVSSVMLVLLVIGMFAWASRIQPLKADGSIYFSVEPVAVAPLTDLNPNINALETPSTPSPVGQNFTVEIHLRGATAANVPTGIAGVEVHFFFGNILTYAIPTGFTDYLGKAGGVLTGPPNKILYANQLPEGFYDRVGNFISSPPYTGAVYYKVAAASLATPTWNGVDGLIVNITFRIISQPYGSLNETMQLTNDFTGMVDANATEISAARVQGTLTIDAGPAPMSTLITFNADGSVTPSTAPISTVDNITYAFTNNINGQITVDRDNIVIDGNGHTLHGADGNGIDLAGRTNVTVKDAQITGFGYGIYLGFSPKDTISGNNITEAVEAGIGLDVSSNYTTITGNNITSNNIGIVTVSSYNIISENNIEANNLDGIWLYLSDYNNISENIVKNSGCGINLSNSSNHNIISENNVTNNDVGIVLVAASGNTIYHNDFTNNTRQVTSDGSPNTWDNGYPSGGNYWSDYACFDYKSGPNQDQPGSDEIMDAPYVINSNNTDHYPLWHADTLVTTTINSDGSITPPSAPILNTANVTYTLTNDIHGGIVVEKTHIVIDGKGHALQGSYINPSGLFPPQSSTGIDMQVGLDVTVKNIQIQSFGYGIWARGTSNSVISGNSMEDNYFGICFISSTDNTISGNNISQANRECILLDWGSHNVISENNVTDTSNDWAIDLVGSSYNSISGNDISCGGGLVLAGSEGNIVSGNDIRGIGPPAESLCEGVCIQDSSSANTISGNNMINCWEGITLWQSSSNTFYENNITNNAYGVYFQHFQMDNQTSSGNMLYHNSFINNTVQTYDKELSTNVWNDGYPSGGNYWSDYNGTDMHSGPYQNETGSDGIGDTPYHITYTQDIDHYPLMHPWSSVALSFTTVLCSLTQVAQGIPVTFTSTVAGASPTGTITWTTSSIGGSFSQSVCTLSKGACSTTYTENLTGSVTISAYYSGDSNNEPSSESIILTVTSGPVYYSQDYTSIQAAINAAPSGATVVCAHGFYTESLTINKTLTIIGEEDPPVFEGGASAIYLTLLPGASGSTITGIEITNWPQGILVENASNCRIYGNILSSVGRGGITLDGSNAMNNLLYKNVFEETPTPINLAGSAEGNTVFGNTFASQGVLTLNIGGQGNIFYGNTLSGSQILLNLTGSYNNIIYHNNFLATSTPTITTTGNNTWDNGYPSGGNYWSNYLNEYPNVAEIGSSGIWNTPYTIGSNNKDGYPLMKPWTPASGHSVAVISVASVKTLIEQSISCNVTVAVANTGEYPETFNVTTYANATVMGTQRVSLNTTGYAILTFTWNTSSLLMCNYTVSAYAWPVPSQTNMSENSFTWGMAKVTVAGDINGDFKVTLTDLVMLAQAYGSKPGDSNWNPNADIDGNGIVGLSDLVILAQHYGQHYP